MGTILRTALHFQKISQTENAKILNENTIPMEKIPLGYQNQRLIATPDCVYIYMIDVNILLGFENGKRIEFENSSEAIKWLKENFS